MTQPFTPRQKRIIQKALDNGKPLTGNVTFSLGVSYQVDLLILLEDNPALFNGNLSHLIRDMVQGYKVDWRDDKSSQFEEIMRKLNSLGRVAETGDVIKTDEFMIKKLDARGGFSEQ